MNKQSRAIAAPQSKPCESRSADDIGAEVALWRAANRAREDARKSGVPIIVVMENGKIVQVPLDDVLEYIQCPHCGSVRSPDLTDTHIHCRWNGKN